MPDYIIDGKQYDLKSIEGVGKNTFDNAVKGQKSQATNFVFDITKCPLPMDEILRKLEAILTNRNRGWIEKLILIDNGEIVKILERI